MDPPGTVDARGAAAPDSAPTCSPIPEVCDGVDNDCDGQVDEGVPVVSSDQANIGGPIVSITGSGSRLSVCGYVPCGETNCLQCGSVTLEGVSISGSYNHSVITNLTASGHALTACGYEPCGETSCPICETLTLSGATVSGGLTGVLSGLSAGAAHTIDLFGYTSCGENTCFTSGSLTFTCAP